MVIFHSYVKLPEGKNAGNVDIIRKQSWHVLASSELPEYV